MAQARKADPDSLASLRAGDADWVFTPYNRLHQPTPYPDPRRLLDADHHRCVEILAGITEPIGSTVPVLTEAFHLLTPGSVGAQRLMDFMAGKGLVPWFLDTRLLQRAMELMMQYADHSMDLADASLVVMAEQLRCGRVFTIDRGDFNTYRFRQGHHQKTFEIL